MTLRQHQDFSKLAGELLDHPIYKFDPAKTIWIFGAGSFGRSLLVAMRNQGLKVADFVETSPKTEIVMDLPVVNWLILSERHPDAQLALGIFNRGAAFDELKAIAAKHGFTNLIMPWHSYDTFSNDLGWRFWLSKREFLMKNLERVSRVSEILADDESRALLFRLTAFRLGMDISFASFKSKENQYFNEITLPILQDKNISYIDCGAFDGDTYLNLISQPGIKCTQSFLMEPDPQNYAFLVKNIGKGNPDVICLPLAAAEKYSILTFSSGQGEGGALGSAGDINVAAIAIDEMLPNGEVDLIKIDVEGAETQVLNGALNTI